MNERTYTRAAVVELVRAALTEACSGVRKRHEAYTLDAHEAWAEAIVSEDEKRRAGDGRT